MPQCGAVMTCSIFIASTTATCWPCAHLVAVGDVDRNNRALNRRGDADRTVGTGQIRRASSLADVDVLFGLHRCIVREQRQRIAAVDPRAGETGVARRRALPLRQSADAARPGPRAPRCARRSSGCGRDRRRNRGCARMLRRKPMLVVTPSRRNSLSARVSRPTATAKSGDGECAITLASSESKEPEVL